MDKLTVRQAELLHFEVEKHITIASHCMENACGRDHVEIANALSAALHILAEEGRVRPCKGSKLATLTASLHRHS